MYVGEGRGSTGSAYLLARRFLIAALSRLARDVRRSALRLLASTMRRALVAAAALVALALICLVRCVVAEVSIEGLGESIDEECGDDLIAMVYAL